MSDDDDWDYGADIQAERDADYEHELAIAENMHERELNDDEQLRRRRGTY